MSSETDSRRQNSQVGGLAKGTRPLAVLFRSCQYILGLHGQLRLIDLQTRRCSIQTSGKLGYATSDGMTTIPRARSDSSDVDYVAPSREEDTFGNALARASCPPFRLVEGLVNDSDDGEQLSHHHRLSTARPLSRSLAARSCIPIDILRPLHASLHDALTVSLNLESPFFTASRVFPHRHG